MKRQRLEPLQKPATFQLIVERAGIIGIVGDVSSTHQRADPPQVEDPRHAKRQMAADLCTTAAQEEFASSLAEALADEHLLRTCLLPIAVTEQASFATGDSFIRMLLNMMSLQQQIASLLLQKLPEFSQAECADNRDGGNSSNSTVPGLILGQLRWLEQVADEAALTSAVLEVLPVCSPTIQQQLVGLLPEFVLPQDHEVVVETLQGLLDQDLCFMAPVLDCYSNMQLEPHLQDCILKSLLQQLPAVEVEDLPGLVKYLISSADKANAEQILGAIRSSLQFVSPVDPRLAVPDHKQKNVMISQSKSPELLLVKELTSTLSGNEAVMAACLKLEAAITETSNHRFFDLLVLLVLLSKTGTSRRSAEVCLKRKLVDGHVTPAWLSKSLQGHQASLHDLRPSLLSLAESWSRAREAPLTAASVQLYVDLFVGIDNSLERQQVLQALHGHLGSGMAGEQDVAVQALLVLATRHQAVLSQYSSYLANVLDHLDGFSDSQLQQIFSMFAALTAVQPVAAGAAHTSGTAGGASSAGGTRLQDELSITLNKALAQNSAQYKRIGVVGTLALLQQSAANHELLSADEAAAGRLQESWIIRADSVFAQCLGHPGAMAFMMDHWAELLEKSAEPTATGEMGITGCMPLLMLEWLYEKTNDLMNTAFLADLERPTGVSQASEDEAAQTGPQPHIQHDDSNLQARLYFNLDGSYSPVYVNVVTLAVAKDPSKRAQLVWLPACLRLMAACLNCSATSLHTIDALLGCPLALPDATLLLDDGSWDGLPLHSKVGVLLSLMHSICWLREVVAVFAPAIDSELQRAAEGASTQATMDNVSDTQNKLLMRTVQLRLLETLFKYLAGTCPSAALQLPDLSMPLLMGSSGTTAPATASAVKHERQGKIDCDIMCKLRCLRPTAALALNVFPDTRMSLTTLLPAAHLVTDLHAKLQMLFTRGRRSASFAAAAAPALPHGLAGLGSTSGAGVPFTAASGPPCLGSVTLQELAERVVSLLPALQRHLSTALTVIRQPPADESEELFKGLPGWNSYTAEATLYGLSSTAQALEAVPAAHQLALACLQCSTLLVKCTKEWSAAKSRLVLAALASQPAAAPEDTTQLLRAAFKSSRKLTSKSSGNSNLQLEMAVLSLLQAITSMAAAHKTPADTQDVMSKRLSLIVDELLKCTWQQEDEAEKDTLHGFSWKGQSVAITQLLTMLISHSPDPSQQILLLADGVLKEVPGKVAAKESLNPCGGYAALCSATFVTWYRVVFEQLVACWQKAVEQGQHLMVPAASMAKDARSLQKPQLNSQGLPDWDEQQVQLLLTRAQRCCQAFTTLVQLTKAHQSRKALLAAAVNLGGKYIEGMLRAMPLWRVLYSSGYDAQFAALVQLVQKGTKILQAVCNEGKVQRAGPLVTKAPAAKRALERFVFEMKAFFHEVGQPETFWMGNLKHRDLAGNTVGSQLSPPEEDGVDDVMGDGAEDQEQEDEGEEGSMAR